MPDKKCKCGCPESSHRGEFGPCYTHQGCFQFEEALPQDAVVEAVRADLLERSKKGIIKYGVTLEKSGLTLEQYLQHAYEETLDHANYLKSALMKIRGEIE